MLSIPVSHGNNYLEKKEKNPQFKLVKTHRKKNPYFPSLRKWHPNFRNEGVKCSFSLAAFLFLISIHFNYYSIL